MASVTAFALFGFCGVSPAYAEEVAPTDPAVTTDPTTTTTEPTTTTTEPTSTTEPTTTVAPENTTGSLEEQSHDEQVPPSSTGP